MLLHRTAILLTAALPHVALAQNGDWPRRIDSEAGELLIRTPPQRVVSTSPSLTGILLAIEAPLIASAATSVGPLTDDRGFFSQWAELAEARGVEVLYPALQFDIEAVIGAAPDLVVASSTGADNGMGYIGELTALGLPAMALDYSDQSWQDMARSLGRATGREAQAQKVIANFDRHAAEAAMRLDHPDDAVSIVGYDIAGSYSIGRRESPQAEVLTTLGFDITPLPEALRGAVSRSTDFDFISRENLSAAIAGETIFLLSGDEADVVALMADPVLANHPAVISGRVYPLGKSSFRIDYYSGMQMIDTVLEHLGAE